jgi:hypothetical protein
MSSTLELVLFENYAEGARIHIGHGISSFIVDWEINGKAARQNGFDTEINPGTPANLRDIASVSNAKAWCRLNCHGPQTSAEIECAIAAGAQVILLPMVRTLSEIESFIDLVAGRSQTGILIEQPEAVRLAPRMRSYSLDYVYFGLNDFAISRGGDNIFRALVDGSVESVRQALPDHCFGVAGLTDISRGCPIPAAALLEEIHRLGCSFTFLRRSFRRDASLIPSGEIIHGIRSYWQECMQRTEDEKLRDHRRLAKLINEL